ncbi:MAG: deoxyribonuclease V [Acidobacteriota bacterium]
MKWPSPPGSRPDPEHEAEAEIPFHIADDGGLRHTWELTPRQAIQLQRRLASAVETQDRLGEGLADVGAVTLVAGVDAGFEEGGSITRAAAVALSLPGLETLAEAVVRRPTSFPYVPGLLSFRELPAVLDALAELETKLQANGHGAPQVLFTDAHGLAHPRRLGLACHLGLWLDRPAVGVAKTRLTGSYDEPPPEQGAWSPLVDPKTEERLGAVLRTRSRVKPVFVSIGHRLSLKSALQLTLAITPRYRLPETTRRSDKLASRR